MGDVDQMAEDAAHVAGPTELDELIVAGGEFATQARIAQSQMHDQASPALTRSQSAALASIATSLHAANLMRRADVAVERMAGDALDAAWEASAPGERESDPGRPATLDELETAQNGTVAADEGAIRYWVKAGDAGEDNEPWRFVAPGDYGWWGSTALLRAGARITHLPTPVGQTPAGPVAAVARVTPLYAEALPGPALDRVIMRALGRELDPQPTEGQRRYARVVYNAIAAELRTEFPDETSALMNAGPVPLASADLLSDEAIDKALREMYQIPAGASINSALRGRFRRAYDLTAAKLRAQFPDETPVEPEALSPRDCPHDAGDNGRCFGCGAPTAFTLFEAGCLPDDEIATAAQEAWEKRFGRADLVVDRSYGEYLRIFVDNLMTRAAAYCERQPEIRRVPAPFVRGVDELTDDELSDAVREASIGRFHEPMRDGHRLYARRLYDSVAARLRVDVPRREAEPAEITAHTLNAAKIGATVMDSENEPWTKTGPEHWTCECRAHLDCLSDRLVDSFGPLRDLREPAEITAAMLDAAVVGAKVTARGATRDLLADWVKLHDDSWRCPGLRRSAARLVADFGPLSNLRPPSEPVPTIPFMTDAEEADSRRFWHEVDAKNAAENADGIDVTRDRLISAALTSAAGWFQRDGLPAQASAASAVDKAARAHVAALHGPTVGADVLSIARVLTDDTIGTGGYEPAELAPGSFIVGPGWRVSLCVHENRDDHLLNRWMVVFRDGDAFQWSWRYDVDITRDGVLVVDGATLGGQR